MTKACTRAAPGAARRTRRAKRKPRRTYTFIDESGLTKRQAEARIVDALVEEYQNARFQLSRDDGLPVTFSVTVHIQPA